MLCVQRRCHFGQTKSRSDDNLKAWPQQEETAMQIKFASVMVHDHENALKFYVGKLGFEVKDDINMGQFRWLTVKSPAGIEGVELILEKTDFPPSATYQKARYEAGIPALALVTTDVRRDFSTLMERGVTFRGEPMDMGFITAVSFEDECGNLINLVQQAKSAP
jgi:predicted enzyme related to lactoylglutathione lyase